MFKGVFELSSSPYVEDGGIHRWELQESLADGCRQRD